MVLEGTKLSKLSQREKAKYHMIYKWDLKKKKKERLIYKTEIDSQT